MTSITTMITKALMPHASVHLPTYSWTQRLSVIIWSSVVCLTSAQAADLSPNTSPAFVNTADTILIGGIPSMTIPSATEVKIGGGIIRAGGLIYTNGKAVNDATILTTGTLSDSRLSVTVR